MRRVNAVTFLAVAPVLALLTGDPLAAQSSLELRGGATVESPHFFVGGLDYVRHVTGPLYISGGLATSARTATGLRTVVEIDEGMALGRQAAESRYLEIPLALRAEFGGERLRARVGVAAVPGIPVECRYSMELYILDALGRITGESRTPEVNCSERNIESDFTVFGRLEAGVQVAVSERIAVVADGGYGFGEPSINWWEAEMTGREEGWRLVGGVRFAFR